MFDKSRAQVHVSGHAGQEELKLVLSIVKPKCFMPVHGEATHLRAHAKLAAATGVNEDNIFILENGDTLELSAKGVRRGEPVESGIVFVDGLSVGDTSQDVLNERSAMVEQGIASVACAISSKTGKITGDVAVQMRGISGGDDEYLLEDAASAVRHGLEKALSKGGKKRDLEKACRQSLQSVLWDRIEQRPLVIVNLLDI